VKTRFCAYCRQFKPDTGFKFVVHAQTLSKRGQCGSCQETRKKPREELNEMARKEVAARRAAQSAAARAAHEKARREDE
jgi:hypothetical protein